MFPPLLAPARTIQVFTLVVLVAASTTAPAQSSDDLPWPARNGPFQTGCAAPRDAEGVPVEWNEATGHNIAWTINLQGFGLSSPVIGNNRIWLTTANEEGTQQFIYAIDAGTGSVLHHKLLFENDDPEPLGNAVNTYASPSCVVETDAVYVHFGSYGTARIDPQTAEVVWQRRDLPCRHFRGPGSSPLVSGDLLILTFDGIDQQYVAALNKHTGETVWRTDRSTDYQDLDPDGRPKLDGDLRKAYGTPSINEVAGHTQLVSIGARALFGYDAASGREIWTVTHSDFNAAAPPVFFENLAIANTGSGGASLMGIRLDESTTGDVTESHVVWNRTRGNSRLCAPALDRGRLWFLTDNGVLYCVDAKTGEELSALRIGGAYVSSPVVAGQYLYVCNEDGQVTVLETTVPPRIVAKNRLSEGMRATPAIAAGAIYLRTYQRLYKIASRE